MLIWKNTNILQSILVSGKFVFVYICRVENPFIIAHVRSTREGNIYAWECLSVHHWWGVYPIPGLGRGYPVLGLVGGSTPSWVWVGGTPSQVSVGGYPVPGLGRGYPIPGLGRGEDHPRSGWGVPHPRSGWWGYPGYPPDQVWRGVPRLPPLARSGWCRVPVVLPPWLDGVPPTMAGWGTPLHQHSEHLLHSGRYASCVHAGGLSCWGEDPNHIADFHSNSNLQIRLTTCGCKKTMIIICFRFTTNPELGLHRRKFNTSQVFTSRDISQKMYPAHLQTCFGNLSTKRSPELIASFEIQNPRFVLKPVETHKIPSVTCIMTRSKGDSSVLRTEQMAKQVAGT